MYLIKLPTIDEIKAAHGLAPDEDPYLMYVRIAAALEVHYEEALRQLKYLQRIQEVVES